MDTRLEKGKGVLKMVILCLGDGGWRGHTSDVTSGYTPKERRRSLENSKIALVRRECEKRCVNVERDI